MIELNLFPDKKNILNFIETNFSNSSTKIPIPKNRLFTYYYILIENFFSQYANKFSEILKLMNIDAESNLVAFLIINFIIFIVFWSILFRLCIKCCGSIIKVDKISSSNKIIKESNSINIKKDEDINEESKINKFKKKNFHSYKKKHKKH